jgi:hypothetical protein
MLSVEEGSEAGGGPGGKLVEEAGGGGVRMEGKCEKV